MRFALRDFFFKKKTAAVALELPEVRRSEMSLESSTIIATIYFFIIRGSVWIGDGIFELTYL